MNEFADTEFTLALNKFDTSSLGLVRFRLVRFIGSNFKHGRTNERTNRWTDGWAVGEWLDRWIDGWMDGWMDERTRMHVEAR